MKKILALLSLVVLVSAGCGSSGSSSSKSATLNIWGTFEDSQNMSPFISAYQQKHPNVQIVYTEKDVSTYEEDLLNALASGTGPDIFAIHNDWLPKYQDKLVEAPSSIISLRDYKDAFVDVAYNDFVKDGKIYAAPLTVDSLALYYNKDILGSTGIAIPPRTWDDLKKDVKKIIQQDSRGYFTRAGAALGTTTNINRPEDMVYLLMLQNGTQPYTSDFSQSTLDQAVQTKSGTTYYPAAQAMSYYTSFANSSADNYSWNTKSNYSVDAFANGEVAFTYGYSYLKDSIKEKSPNLNFDVAPAPQPSLNQNQVNYANYWGFGVSKQSKNPSYSWDFIKSMVGKDALKDYYTRHSLPSGRKDIINDQIADPEIGVFAAQNLTAKSFYKKDQVKVDKIIRSAVDDIVLRGKQVEDALSSVSEQINALSAAGR